MSSPVGYEELPNDGTDYGGRRSRSGSGVGTGSPSGSPRCTTPTAVAIMGVDGPPCGGGGSGQTQRYPVKLGLSPETLKRFMEHPPIVSQNMFQSHSTKEIKFSEIQIGRQVGHGAFSEVFEGYFNKCHVAVKILKVSTKDSYLARRFHHEVTILQQARHPNVVTLYGACSNPPAIITEFLDGGTLYEYLHKTTTDSTTSYTPTSLPLCVALPIALTLATAMSYLHRIGIQHRDLTSNNILLHGVEAQVTACPLHNGRIPLVKISDFGLSRGPLPSESQLPPGSSKLVIGGICHPRWRPPEITLNSAVISNKCDVYSFALVLWELVTGEIPFRDLSNIDAANNAAMYGLRPTIPRTLPPAVRRLIESCWHHDQSCRPGFEEIAFTLQRILLEEAGLCSS